MLTTPNLQVCAVGCADTQQVIGGTASGFQAHRGFGWVSPPVAKIPERDSLLDESDGGVTTIDNDVLGGEVGRGVGGEEADQPRDVLRRGHTSLRDQRFPFTTK